MDVTSDEVLNQRESEVEPCGLGNLGARPIFSEKWPSPPSNTGGSKTTSSRWKQAGKYTVAAGIDWLSGCLYGKLKEPERWREALKTLGSTVTELPNGVGLYFGKRPALYVGNGFRWGAHQVDSQFQIEDGRARVCFGEIPEQPNEESFVAYIEIPGLGCTGKAFRQIVDELGKLVDTIGVEEPLFKPSRMDFYADVQGYSVREFKAAFDGDEVHCQAITNREDRVQHFPTGISFGTRGAPVYLRVYDKIAQLRSATPTAAKALHAYRSASPEALKGELTRFEFEVKRDALVEDRFRLKDHRMFPYLTCIGAGYLFEDWLRIVERDSASRKTRAPEKAWWTELKMIVIESFRVQCDEAPEVTPEPFDPSHMLKSIGGSLVTIAAKLCHGDLYQAREMLAVFMNDNHEAYSVKAAKKMEELFPALEMQQKRSA